MQKLRIKNADLWNGEIQIVSGVDPGAICFIDHELRGFRNNPLQGQYDLYGDIVPDGWCFHYGNDIPAEINDGTSLAQRNVYLHPMSVTKVLYLGWTIMRTGEVYYSEVTSNGTPKRCEGAFGCKKTLKVGVFQKIVPGGRWLKPILSSIKARRS